MKPLAMSWAAVRGVACGEEDAVVHADAVGGVGLFAGDDDAVVRCEGGEVGHLFHDDESVVAEVGDAAFEVEDGGHGADVDGGGGVAFGREEGCELAGAFFVGAMGEAEEEVVFGFADVAAV